MGFLSSIGQSWEVVKQSWGVLKSDRSLAIFPILSTISAILMIALVFGPASWIMGGSEEPSTPLLIGAFALVLYLVSFTTIFFNVALVSCARRSFQGEDTKVGEGIAAAFMRLPQIATWAFISMVIGLILRALDALADEAPFPLNILANIGVWMLGGLWSVMTYFVIPVIAYEGVGGFESVRRSRDVVTQRWGQSIIGNVTIGLLAFIAGMLPAGILMFVGFKIAEDSVAVGYTLIAAGVVILAGSMVLSSTLTQIFNAAMYNYVTGGPTPVSISAGTYQQAFRNR